MDTSEGSTFQKNLMAVISELSKAGLLVIDGNAIKVTFENEVANSVHTMTVFPDAVEVINNLHTLLKTMDGTDEDQLKSAGNLIGQLFKRNGLDSAILYTVAFSVVENNSIGDVQTAEAIVSIFNRKKSLRDYIPSLTNMIVSVALDGGAYDVNKYLSSVESIEVNDDTDTDTVVPEVVETSESNQEQTQNEQTIDTPRVVFKPPF